MHTFSIKKTSLVVDDTELTDDEVAFALRVRALLPGQFSDEFWTYIRELTLTFRLAPDETKLAVGFSLFIPQMGTDMTLEFNTLLIDRPNMADVVAVTSVTHVEDLLRIYARETGEHQAALQEAARMARR